MESCESIHSVISAIPPRIQPFEIKDRRYRGIEGRENAGSFPRPRARNRLPIVLETTTTTMKSRFLYFNCIRMRRPSKFGMAAILLELDAAFRLRKPLSLLTTSG